MRRRVRAVVAAQAGPSARADPVAAGSGPGPSTRADVRPAPRGGIAARATPPRARGSAPGGEREGVRSAAEPGAVVEVGTAVVLDLLETACASGAGVPRALTAVGEAVGGRRGEALRTAGAALVLGARWDEAWAGAPGPLRPVERALRPAWEDGAPVRELLRAAAEGARRDRQARATEAAERLGVRLVLPLGLCFLPAFVLVGLVPVVLSMVGPAAP